MTLYRSVHFLVSSSSILFIRYMYIWVTCSNECKEQNHKCLPSQFLWIIKYASWILHPLTILVSLHCLSLLCCCWLLAMLLAYCSPCSMRRGFIGDADMAAVQYSSSVLVQRYSVGLCPLLQHPIYICSVVHRWLVYAASPPCICRPISSAWRYQNRMQFTLFLLFMCTSHVMRRRKLIFNV